MLSALTLALVRRYASLILKKTLKILFPCIHCKNSRKKEKVTLLSLSQVT